MDELRSVIEESIACAPEEIREEWARYVTHSAEGMWRRPFASPRNRSLVTVAAVAAIGGAAELRTQVRLARQHGLTRLELCELMMQVAGYGGLTLAREGMLALSEVFDAEGERPTEPSRLPTPEHEWPEDRRERARAVTAVRHGQAWADRVYDSMVAFQPDESFDPETLQWRAWTMETAFGELWPRANLTLTERARVTIAVLVVGGRALELKSHIDGGLELGISEEEMMELLMQLAPYVGFPAVVEAAKATAELVADRRSTEDA